MIGKETTGNDIGGEFLIRDQVVSYWLILPVPLNGLDRDVSILTAQPRKGAAFSFPMSMGRPQATRNLTLTIRPRYPPPPPGQCSCSDLRSLGFAGLPRLEQERRVHRLNSATPSIREEAWAARALVGLLTESQLGRSPLQAKGPRSHAPYAERPRVPPRPRGARPDDYE